MLGIRVSDQGKQSVNVNKHKDDMDVRLGRQGLCNSYHKNVEGLK